MKKILFINSTPKSKDNSYTLKMAYELMNSYKKEHPNDEITELNLYEEDIKFLDLFTIDNMFGPNNKQLDIIKYTNQFAEADIYIIAAPMWNLTVPAILRAYFDYVNITGITFKYTENGAVGLLKDMGKKVIFVASRGGLYSAPPWEKFEMGERYVRKQFEFLGIDEMETLLFENADVYKGEELEKAFAASMKYANELGRNI